MRILYSLSHILLISMRIQYSLLIFPYPLQAVQCVPYYSLLNVYSVFILYPSSLTPYLFLLAIPYSLIYRVYTRHSLVLPPAP